MYVTFPSSESKIFTLSQGHLAATALSQAGSGCDTVNGGHEGGGNCCGPPKQTLQLAGAAGSGGRWESAPRARWGWAGSRACNSASQGGNGRTELVPGARERKFTESGQTCPASPPATLPTHAAPACLVPEAAATPTSPLYLPSRSC